jgi:hypothetical protein
MNKIKVLYCNLSFRENRPNVPSEVNAKDYELITEIDRETNTYIALLGFKPEDDLELVFRIMNVVNNADYELPQKLRVRSMCVGDIIITADDKVWLCSTIGFSEITDERVKLDLFKKAVG